MPKRKTHMKLNSEASEKSDRQTKKKIGTLNFGIGEIANNVITSISGHV